MPLNCIRCWDRENILSCDVQQQDVADKKWGFLKGAWVCSHCISIGIVTRATCKTYFRAKTLISMRGADDIQEYE